MKLGGRCACAKVTYELSNEPLFTQACHCKDCQRTTGSAFVVHLVVAELDFSIHGETHSSIVPTGSGAGCELHFCVACGTYLWCRYLYHRVAVIAVRAGTLDDPSAVNPKAHIFTKSKQQWVELPTDVPAFDEAFDKNEVWPQQSIEKYNAQPAR